MSYTIITLVGQQLHRDATTGKKLIDNNPIGFPGNWIELSSTVETLTTSEGITLAHTGKSNIIAIDFDDQLFEEALAIDATLQPEHRCRYIARSVDKPGGHLIYSRPLTPEGTPSENYLTSYIGKSNGKKLAKLDVLYGETLCFLATRSNKTKELVHYAEPLTEIPLAIQTLCIAHYARHQASTPTNSLTIGNTSAIQGSKLGFLAEEALTNDKALFHFLGVITPRQWKEILAQADSNLPANHPDRLPMTESAHMYIVSLSAVLMLDPSIDQEIHSKLIKKINNLFSSPLDAQRLNTILKRDLTKSNYDKEWQAKSFIMMNRRHEPLEVFKYSSKGTNKFLIYNHVTSELINYDAVSPVVDYFLSESSTRVDRHRLITTASHVNIIDRPDEPFGHNMLARTFNMYKWTAEQEIFYNPEGYEKEYNYPETTIRALESSIGVEQLHKRFLPFMRRKFMTREHSPLFFVFYGVPHSFKSAVVNGVFAKLAHRRVSQPSLEVLTDKYNDFLVNKDFIVLDEIQHYLQHEKAKLIKAIKEYTGNSVIAGIRAMHASLDNNTYASEATFVLTTNETTQLTTEAGDRRMVVFKSLIRVADALGMSNTAIQYAIQKETKDFAYYLSTQVENLDGDTYRENYKWQDDAYKMFQETSLSLEDRVAKAIDSKDYSMLFNLLLESGANHEIIAKSVYTTPRKSGFLLRLLNTKEHVSEVPSVLERTNLDCKKLRKKLEQIAHVTHNANEYIAGTSTFTGNRKTELNIVTMPVPAEIAKHVVDTSVKSIDGDCEL